MNSGTNLNPLMNIDPDTNFFSHFASCHVSSDYYLEDAFNGKCQHKTITPDNLFNDSYKH